ncbi:MAG: PAS domain-containing protein, partial [Promethearchaeota archaeon]
MKVIETPKDIGHELTERKKELDCLFQISDLLNFSDQKFDEIIEKLLYLIQSAMEFPNLANVIIKVKEKEYQTQNFKKTDWKISSKVGEGESDLSIEVCYQENRYFVPEKLDLVEEIAFKLKSFIKQKDNEKRLEIFKKSQIDIKDSEEKFRRIFETIPDLYFLVDDKGTHLDFKGNEDLLFLTPDKFLGKTINQTMPSNVFEKYDKAIKETLKTGKSTTIEYSLPSNDEVRFYEARNLYFSKDQVAIFVRDITNRKKMERKLVESEEEFRLLNSELEQKVIEKTRELYQSEKEYRELFNHMTSGVAIYNAVDDGEDFIFKDINKAGEQISEVKKEKIVNQRVSEIFPRIKDFGLFNVFQKVWKTGVPESFPISLYEDKKVSHWVENYVYKLPTGEIVAVYDNVTDKKIADLKLKESEEKFKSIFMNSPIGIELYDSDGKLIDVNRACLDMFGASEVSSVKGFDLFQDPNVSED